MRQLIRISPEHPSLTSWLAQNQQAGVPFDLACTRWDEHRQAEIWSNMDFQVIVYHGHLGEFNPQQLINLVWLSIRRQNGKPVIRWTDLQEIKNQLVGPECELVQLLPAESRKVDMVNQYHLVGWSDPDYSFPFGFKNREVKP